MVGAYDSAALVEIVNSAMNWLWRIIPWGRIESLTFQIGQSGPFYADTLLFAVPFVVVDGILDKVYERLK